MQSPLFSALVPVDVLLLSQRESSVRTEISTLRALGVSAIAHQYNTASALSFLEEKTGASHGKKTGVDIILCDERFENRLVFHFLLKLARKPRLAQTPVLLVTSSRTTADVASRCGVSVIARPYTQKQMQEALAKAMSPLRRALNAQKLAACCAAAGNAPKAAPTATTRVLTTSDIMRKGLALMKKGETDAAEQEFLAVLRRQEDHVEANLALAKLYRAQGDAAATTSFLLRAAAACQRNNEFKHASAIRALLPEDMRKGSVFQQEAMAALRVGDYRAAALGLLEYCGEHPDQPLYAAVARACQMTRAPQESLLMLCNAYERLGKKDLAEKLRRRLLEEPGSTLPIMPSWLDKFPRLREVVNVATFTAWAWRQA